MKKIAALILAAVMALCALSAFAADADWTAEDWDAKTVKYQFTGTWEMLEYNFRFQFLFNLYEDGTVMVDQFNALQGSGYRQFGTWSEEADEDGNVITVDVLFCTPLEGTDLVPHEYSYELYEESDGNYSFGYDFGMAPGQYFRTVDLTGGPTINYATAAEFEAAVNEVVAE